ncbi:hypothetical protein FOCC_FOCC007050 [Frankliniella occidentalis]|nr:hypothetical protein FOCC_FOCC007050 [Frankliniella occidentalis]
MLSTARFKHVFVAHVLGAYSPGGTCAAEGGSGGGSGGGMGRRAGGRYGSTVSLRLEAGGGGAFSDGGPYLGGPSPDTEVGPLPPPRWFVSPSASLPPTGTPPGPPGPPPPPPPPSFWSRVSWMMDLGAQHCVPALRHLNSSVISAFPVGGQGG